jgi:ubiquinone/menaquinone biosynthesis C-methylase UbiE
MKRLKDWFLSKLNELISLKWDILLEIGCGNGSRSVWFAELSKQLFAIDPNAPLIEIAKERNIVNATFILWEAQNLDYETWFFDMIIFSLSFHHIPQEDMERSIEEAIRVVKKWWYIVFFEPTEEGSFFDAEILFDACDGDERTAKRNAYSAIISNSKLKQCKEFYDETIFQLDSVEDFIETFNPKKNMDDILPFLIKNNFLLNATRRANIFQPL